jgi:hypothetical protein
MTLQDLAKELDRLGSGARIGVAENIYDAMFPASESAADARDACIIFATSQGCAVLYAPETRTIWFVKQTVRTKQKTVLSADPLSMLGRWLGRDSPVAALVANPKSRR